MDLRVNETARALLDAYTGAPLAPIRTRFDAGDTAAAYAVQQIQVSHWIEQGRRQVGRKIGLTSPAVQKQLGVAEPDFGHLFADMVYGTGETIPVSRLQQPRVEAEIALILSRDLDMAHATVADVIAAIGCVLPALEVVGSRIAGWNIDIVDTIADNASSGVLVLGGPAQRLEGLDLINCPMTLTLNGKGVSSGYGRDCLGGPLNAAVWLARRSRELGRPLEEGELVMTGALGPMTSIQAGDVVHATIGGIGQVGVQFA
jgi:2-keto-4-pentenoate hydratase